MGSSLPTNVTVAQTLSSSNDAHLLTIVPEGFKILADFRVVAEGSPCREDRAPRGSVTVSKRQEYGARRLPPARVSPKSYLLLAR